MRNQGICVVLALGGCLSNGDRMSVADLGRSELSINASPSGLVAYFERSDGDCTLLPDDLEATLGGAPMKIDAGRWSNTLGEGKECLAGHVSIDRGALDTAPDARLELRLADGSGDVTAILIGPFAPRTFTWASPADGTLVPGSTAQIAWSPATDTLQPIYGDREVSLLFHRSTDTSQSSAVIGATPSGTSPDSFSIADRWVRLSITPGSLSFVVPDGTRTGPLSGYFKAKATGQVLGCGFAACTVVTSMERMISAQL